MSAVLQTIGLTKDQVARQMAEGGKWKAEGGKRRAGISVLPVMDSQNPQVAPVLSDGDVERIAARIAVFLRGRMRQARRDMTQRKGPMRCPEKLAGVLQVVADHFGLGTASVLGVSRMQPRARARQVFIWEALRRVDWTLSEAERELGIARNAIDHARTAVENMRDWNNPIGASVRECVEKLNRGQHE